MSLIQMVANSTISVEELEKAPELIERARLVNQGIEACKKNLLFPWGVDKLNCYEYTDNAGEYSAWGTFNREGIFVCYCNWGGNHEIGRVNFNSPKEVFLAFENNDFQHDLTRFLKSQISESKRK